MSAAPRATDAPGWPEAPIAGVGLHFSSLPSPYGIGDIADSAFRFVEQVSRMKLGVWQVLPTGPTAFGDSPYQPLSAFAGNEMLIGIEPLLREQLLDDDEVSGLGDLHDAHVNFGVLIPRKWSVLERAAGRFLSRSRAEPEYEAFLARNDEGWLHDYAIYRVLKTLHDERPWTEWAREYAARAPDALTRVEAEQRDAIDRIKAMQFFFDRQWADLRARASKHSIRLFGDMPFYIALDSSDAWSGAAELQIDEGGRPRAVAGVPPDYFSEDGQLWGNPLYDWARHAQSGYRWWIARLAAAASRYDMVRVDHFRGFEAYWSVPAGARSAREGEWKAGPGDAVFEAVTDAIGAPPIVAEDLGVITGEVERLRRRHGIPGMKVLQFELDDPDFDPSAIDEDCVVYTGTHDNDTTAGWYAGGEHDIRSRRAIRRARRSARRLAGGRARTIAHDLIRLAFSTPARVAVAPMQDYLQLGSEARMNRPGSRAGNWRWRMRAEQLSRSRMAEIADLVAGGGRG